MDMDREHIAARIRTDTTALLKASDAHIVIGIVLGADGGVSECSHVMRPDQAAYLMAEVTRAARVALVEINTGNYLEP